MQRDDKQLSQLYNSGTVAKSHSATASSLYLFEY